MQGKEKIYRTLAYGCFFLAGAAVARLQWHIAVDIHRDALVQYYFETLILFPVFALLGLVYATKVDDSLLRLLAAASGLLFVFQILGEGAILPGAVQNGYARVFAVACLASPLVAVLLRSLLARIAVLGVAGALVVGLSAFWDRDLGVFPLPLGEPTEQEVLLLRAAELGYTAGATRSLEAGADIRVRDQYGRDALYHAASAGHAAVVTLLLQQGANPNTWERKIGMVCRNEDCTRGTILDGSTALIAAVAGGHTEVVALLLEAGADKALQDVFGNTALDMAKRAGREEIAELLTAQASLEGS